MERKMFFVGDRGCTGMCDKVVVRYDFARVKAVTSCGEEMSSEASARCPYVKEGRCSLTPQQRMAQRVVTILHHDESEGLQWLRTKTDLVELAHAAYESGMVRDESGVPMDFKQLLTVLCGIVHVPVPRAAHQLLRNAMNRKGLKALPLGERM